MLLSRVSRRVLKSGVLTNSSPNVVCVISATRRFLSAVSKNLTWLGISCPSRIGKSMILKSTSVSGVKVESKCGDDTNDRKVMEQQKNRRVAMDIRILQMLSL
jgi:hypothetical protein